MIKMRCWMNQSRTGVYLSRIQRNVQVSLLFMNCYAIGKGSTFLPTMESSLSWKLFQIILKWLMLIRNWIFSNMSILLTSCISNFFFIYLNEGVFTINHFIKILLMKGSNHLILGNRILLKPKKFLWMLWRRLEISYRRMMKNCFISLWINFYSMNVIWKRKIVLWFNFGKMIKMNKF